MDELGFCLGEVEMIPAIFMIIGFVLFLGAVLAYAKMIIDHDLEEMRETISRRSLNTTEKIRKFERELAQYRQVEAVLSRL